MGDRPAGLRQVDRAARVAALRAAIAAPQPLVLPGVVTAMTALQAERAGFQACYLTGAGVANFEYGLPDVGLIGLTDIADQLDRVCAATTLPVVVDIDTGYGGPLAVMRTVQVVQRAGAAGIQLEDQEMPKRCGHFDRKRVVTVDEMVAKVHAATSACENGTVVIARTDALSVEGTEAAIHRAHAYREAGADVLFVEAPGSEEDLEKIATSLAPAPLVVNIVEGGRTPELDAATLGRMGFSIVLYANALMRVMARAAEDALTTLRADGTTRGLHDRMLDWASRQALVGLDEADRLEDRFRGLES